MTRFASTSMNSIPRNSGVSMWRRAISKSCSGTRVTLEHMFDCGKPGKGCRRVVQAAIGPGNGNDRGPTCPGRVEVIDREPLRLTGGT